MGAIYLMFGCSLSELIKKRLADQFQALKSFDTALHHDPGSPRPPRSQGCRTALPPAQADSNDALRDTVDPDDHAPTVLAPAHDEPPDSDHEDFNEGGDRGGFDGLWHHTRAPLCVLPRPISCPSACYNSGRSLGLGSPRSHPNQVHGIRVQVWETRRSRH